MLQSCKYCGRIHDRAYHCPAKPVYDKGDTEAKRYRSSKAWRDLRQQALERDGYCCQVCADESKGTKKNYESIEVHHIVPIVEDEDKKDDINNIICLCRYHHELAESGEIPKTYLIDLLTKKISAGEVTHL